MRIAYITRSAFGLLGGASSYYVPVHAARHHEVMVLCPVARASREEVVYRNAELDIRDVHWQLGADLVAGLFDELRSFDPDIVHLFHSRHCLQILYSLRRLFPRSRWIIDFRSPPVLGAGAAHTALLLRYFLCQFYVDRIFTHSLRTMRDNIPLCFRRVIEVPPGVDLAGFPAPRPVPEQLRRFLYIGSIAAVRRLDMLVEGFAKFARDGGAQPHLQMIGGGDALAGLRALVRRRGLQDLIGFSGAQPQETVHRRLGEHDAGIAWVPSELYSRAPSLKMLEYSAAGLPFMASNTVGHRDYADRFGFRFERFENTVEDVADGLRRLCRGRQLAADVAANLEAVARFDWKRIVEAEVLPVYESLCPAGAVAAAGAGLK